MICSLGINYISLFYVLNTFTMVKYVVTECYVDVIIILNTLNWLQNHIDTKI